MNCASSTLVLLLYCLRHLVWSGRNCSHGVIFLLRVNLYTCCKQSKNPTMAWSNLDEMEKRQLKWNYLQQISLPTVGRWLIIYKSQFWAFPWNIHNFLKLLFISCYWNFLLSDVQLSAMFDGEKGKPLEVIFGFVAKSIISLTLNGLILFQLYFPWIRFIQRWNYRQHPRF